MPGKISYMQIFGGKKTGSSHISRGIPCQDAFFFDITAKGEMIISVADGLGSAKFSDIGAEIAVKTAVNTIKDIFDLESDYGIPEASLMKNREIAMEAFSSARTALERYAADNRIQLKELGCTLLVLFTCEGYVTTGHIGDGAITALAGEDLLVLSGPGESEYVNEVTPLTSDGYEKKIRINENISGISALAVFTDGCQRAFLEKKDAVHTPYEPFFRPFFNYLMNLSGEEDGSAEIENFLGSEKMEKNSEDDKTLVAAVLTEGSSR